MTLVLLLAPLLIGVVRQVKARLMRRAGPAAAAALPRSAAPADARKSVLAENASWLFRTAPYLIFAATWVAAALVPTFATGLMFNWTADLVALVALLGSARFFLALAGMDVGTSFGGIGSSREMMIAALAEPAMLMVVFTVADRRHDRAVRRRRFHDERRAVGLRVSLALSLIALLDRGHRRECPHPDRQPGDASRAHHGPRGHGAGVFRPASGADRGRAAC